MNFEHLKYLTVIARTGSISAAARELYLSQPYLSGTLSRLEKELGFAVFLRTSKQLLITDEGRDLLKSAELILREMEKIEEISDRLKCPPLKIAALYSASFMKCFLKFKAECSDCPADCYAEMGNEEVIYSVAERRSDLGIICYAPSKLGKYSGLAENVHVRFEELLPPFPVYVLISSAHPLAEQKTVSAADLAAHPYVCYNDPSNLRYLKVLGIEEKRDTLRVSDRGGMMDAVRSGKYLTVSSYYDSGLQPGMELIPFKDREFYLGASALCRNDHPFTKRESEFLSFLRQQFAAQLPGTSSESPSHKKGAGSSQFAAQSSENS